MAEREDPPPTPLRPVRSAPAEPATAGDSADPTAGLEAALQSLEAKLQSSDGIDALTDWIGQVESVVSGIGDADLDRTRSEIRELIDRLLELNAQVQNLFRLKQLLS